MITFLLTIIASLIIFLFVVLMIEAHAEANGKDTFLRRLIRGGKS